MLLSDGFDCFPVFWSDWAFLAVVNPTVLALLGQPGPLLRYVRCVFEFGLVNAFILVLVKAFDRAEVFPDQGLDCIGVFTTLPGRL